MGRKRRLRLRRADSRGAGGSGRAGGAGQSKTEHNSGGGLAERFGLKGEPDRDKAKGLRDLINQLRRDTMRPDFDRDAYVRGMLEQGAPKELVMLVDGMVHLSKDKEMSASVAVLSAINVGNLGEAKRLIEEAERLHGCDMSMHRYEILDCEGKLEEALTLCEDNIVGDKGEMRWIDAKAGILNQMGRAEERLELYETWQKKFGEHPDWQAGRARALVGVGRLNEAEQIATGILESGEYPDTACVALGEVLMARGDHKGAVKLFNRALDMDESDDRGYIGKAEALAAMGRRKEALKVCDMRLDLSKASGQLKRVRDRILVLAEG